MRILLVRHGQSRSNVDGSENLRVADHAIALSPDGEAQARRCGEFLGDWLDANAIAPGSPPRLAAVRLWHSPYLRTRQTASIIEAHCRLRRDVLVTGDRGLRAAGDSCFLDRKEHVLLAEQQFGIFDGLTPRARRGTPTFTRTTRSASASRASCGRRCPWASRASRCASACTSRSARSSATPAATASTPSWSWATAPRTARS
jgi:bisphosphoglycerate-dependent phosphoglycerate mutase